MTSILKQSVIRLLSVLSLHGEDALLYNYRGQCTERAAAAAKNHSRSERRAARLTAFDMTDTFIWVRNVCNSISWSSNGPTLLSERMIPA